MQVKVEKYSKIIFYKNNEKKSQKNEVADYAHLVDKVIFKRKLFYGDSSKFALSNLVN